MLPAYASAVRLPRAWTAGLVAVVLTAWVGMLIVPMSHEIPTFVAAWLLMVVAMMVPTVSRPMLRVSQGSGSRALVFITAYVLTWTLSLPLALLIMRVQIWNSASVLLLWIAVGIYQVLPSTARNLRHCRSLDATAAPSVLGVRQGLSCMIACLPLMLAVMLSAMVWAPAPLPTALIVLAACVFMMWEKAPSVSRTSIRLSGVVIILASTVAFTMGVGMESADRLHDDAAHAAGVSRS